MSKQPFLSGSRNRLLHMLCLFYSGLDCSAELLGCSPREETKPAAIR